MSKYTIHSTKEDYQEIYDKLEVIELTTYTTLDWKKIKRTGFDSLEMLLNMLERKYNI